MGIRKSVKDYNQLTNLDQRLNSLQSIDTTITQCIPSFVHGAPESAFSTFWVSRSYILR
ncbi:hypothetical protein [Flavobacterium sp. 3HN19-14]|uniref:hypothetical protein n=1 Tax=Flavobacterium sp. 3HN19-14 TaxID=3448133 RepID=UPI003EE142E8